MSLRRSARNLAKAAPIVPEAADASYQKVNTNGTRKTTITAPKKATPKKATVPKTRKVPETSTATPTNITNLSDTTTETGTPSNAAKSLDVTKPAEIFTIPNSPSTPLPNKRRRKANTVSSAKPTPSTPPPSGISPIPGSSNARKTNADHMLDDLASLNRPAEPHATNAPILTPNGSQVVVTNADSSTRKRKAKDLPPDVGSPLKPPHSTIDTLLKDAEAYLTSVDETGKLAKLIPGHRCKMFSPEGLREVVDPFTALASGIIGQQVSGQAAASIRKKFTSLFSCHPVFPSPSDVLTKDLPTLRTAGLSQRKAEYISGLAEKFATGEFTAEGLVSASDDELIEKLVAVRGLGRWSVEMFACFGLKRMDVFSTGDLGVQRGMAAYMGRDVSKLKNKGGKWKYMSEAEMLSIASKFSPYRSLFMWYMWRIADVETEVLE